MAASESLPPSQVTIKMMIIVMVMAMVLEMMKNLDEFSVLDILDSVSITVGG